MLLYASSFPFPLQNGAPQGHYNRVTFYSRPRPNILKPTRFYSKLVCFSCMILDILDYLTCFGLLDFPEILDADERIRLM